MGDPIPHISSATSVPHAAAGQPADSQLRDVFDDFVGQTMFGQMLAAMRKTTGKPAYLHGGRAEEIFQGQMDQLLAEELTEATAGQFSGPMFDLLTLPRR